MPPPTFVSFAGSTRLASGELVEVARETKAYLDGGGREAVSIFDDATGGPIDLDFEGSPDEVVARVLEDPAHAPPRRKVGRPKLGVVSREVSLLPRHWAWIEKQRGGASAVLRRVIEEASKASRAKDAARVARDAAAKFMWHIAGDLPDFEEATRALYQKRDADVERLMATWPDDIRAHATRLIAEAARWDREAEAEARRARPEDES